MKHTSHLRQAKSRLLAISSWVLRNRWLAIMVACMLVGAIVILTKAATSTIGIEAEAGTPDGKASVVGNSGASKQSAIKFSNSTDTTTGWWAPPQNTRWQWVLEGSVDVSQASLDRFDMFDIDLTDAVPAPTTQTVTWANGETRTITWPKGANGDAFTALKNAHKKVICYMDTGAFETYEPDATLFPGKWGANNTSREIAYNGPAAYANVDVIGGKSEDSAGGTFEGEYWLDIIQGSWQYWAPIMWGRLQLAKSIGCDGIEGDQNNNYGNDTTFTTSEAISLRWYREVYYQIHSRNMTAISKNGIELTSQQITEPTNISYCAVGSKMCIPDGILNEECQQYSECDSLNPATTKGIWVGQVEYRGTATTICGPANTAKRMTMRKPDNYAVTSTVNFACWEQ